jgi:hypothetical protein
MAAFIVLGFAAFVGMTAPEPPQGAQAAESPIIVVDTTEGENAASVTLQSVTAFVSAYTCEPVATNPMNPCNITRWGSDPFTHGAACPESWRGSVVEVAGVRYDCDDTPRHDYINGLPHIDLRLSTVQAALRWGIQEREIWRVE